MHDAFDTLINEEDSIVWANRKGAGMWLSWGKVQKVGAKVLTVYRMKPFPQRFINLSQGDNIMVLP